MPRARDEKGSGWRLRFARGTAERRVTIARGAAAKRSDSAQQSTSPVQYDCDQSQEGDGSTVCDAAGPQASAEKRVRLPVNDLVVVCCLIISAGQG